MLSKSKLKCYLLSSVDHHHHHYENNDDCSLDSAEYLFLAHDGIVDEDQSTANNTEAVEEPQLPKFLFKIKEETNLLKSVLREVLYNESKGKQRTVCRMLGLMAITSLVLMMHS